jgi:serine/threonine-protein kinase
MTTPESPGATEESRYALFSEIACGGMAMVYLAQLVGEHGFRRTVAVKRMHPQYARDPEFRAMFLDEAKLVARLQHPNVVATLDIVTKATEVLIVMEYVDGVPVSTLARNGGPIPPRIAVALIYDTLSGLHAAHELTKADGSSLEVIHRDVSPQNILVGRDGTARIIDFGVARAADRASTTEEGAIKGKLAYMASEQLAGEDLDRRVDVYAAGVVLWEMLTGMRLFAHKTESALVAEVFKGAERRPSELRTGDPEVARLDPLVMRALALNATDRYPTALAMAEALANAVSPASRHEVAAWVAKAAKEALSENTARLRAVERGEKAPTPEMPAVEAALTVVSGRGASGRALENPITETSAKKIPDDPTTTAGQSVSRMVAAKPVRPAHGLFIGIGVGVVALVAGIVGFLRFGHAPAHENVAAVGPPVVDAGTVAPAAPPVSAPPVVELPSTRPPPKPAAPAPRGKPGAAKPDCHPPYTLDAQGNRHFKVECL